MSNYKIRTRPSLIPWSERVIVSLDNKTRAAIRFHHRLFDKRVVSLDWAERNNPFAAGVAYRAFEQLMQQRGVERIETECHLASRKIVAKLGYQLDSRTTNNIDLDYVPMMKILHV